MVYIFTEIAQIMDLTGSFKFAFLGSVVLAMFSDFLKFALQETF